MTMIARQRLLETLKNGSRLTSKQIQSRYGVCNPHDLVYQLRENGYIVLLSPKTNSKGETKNFYSLAKRKRKV